MAIQFLNNVNADSGVLYVDAVNDRVGIGTTSPSYTLDVQKSNAKLRIYDTTGNTTLNLSSGNTAINIIEFGDTDDDNIGKIQYRHSSDSMSFNVNASEAMRIDSNGDVGIGKTSPGFKLDVESSQANVVRFGSTGNTGGILLVNSGTTDAVAIQAQADNLQFRVDNGHINFKTNTGASAVTRMRVASDGNVGIGTTSPSAKLHVNGQTAFLVTDGNETGLSINNGTYIYKIGDIDGGENQSFIEIDSASQKTIFNNTNVGIGTTSPSSLIEMSATLDNTSSKLLRLTRSNQGSGPAKAVGFYSNSGERGSITVSNFATAYNTSSDYRLKENVIPIEDGINRLMSLKPCRFNFISEEQVVDGFLAHEAQNIVPEAISGEKDQIDEDGNEVYQGIDQAKLVPLLTAALQEAIKRIEILEQKNK